MTVHTRLLLDHNLAADHRLSQAADHCPQLRPGDIVEQQGEAELVAIVCSKDEPEEQAPVDARLGHRYVAARCRARGSLDRHATYIAAAYLAGAAR